MDVNEARTLIQQEVETVYQFENYLIEGGVGLQLMEIFARELFLSGDAASKPVHPNNTSTPVDVIHTSLNELEQSIDRSDDNPESIVIRIAGAAAALELTTRFARKVDPKVLPAEFIPSEQLIEAVLIVFHDQMQTAKA